MDSISGQEFKIVVDDDASEEFLSERRERSSGESIEVGAGAFGRPAGMEVIPEDESDSGSEVEGGARATGDQQAQSGRSSAASGADAAFALHLRFLQGIQPGPGAVEDCESGEGSEDTSEGSRKGGAPKLIAGPP